MSPSNEFARLWQAEVSGIELFQARLVHHRFGKHFHDAYTLGLNDGGQGRFFQGGAHHSAGAGTVNLINPGDVHTGQSDSDSGWQFRNLYISPTSLRRLIAQITDSAQELPYFASPVVVDRELQRSLSRVFNALSRPTPLLARQTLILEGMATLLDRHGSTPPRSRSPQPESQAIAVVRAYLEAHAAEPITIEALANLAHLSPYYLIRCFHQQVGLPPHAYQRHWQVLQAKRALRRGDQPLSEIAIAHGFYDQSHLTRVFKQTFGVTPGQYKKAISSKPSLWHLP